MKILSSLALVLVGACAFAQNLFSVSISPTNTDVSNVNALLRYQSGETSIGFAVPVAPLAAAGSTTTADFSANVELSTLTYGFLGSYGASGVTLGVDATTANALVGSSWETIFTNPLYSEANVRAALDTNNVGFTFLFADYLSTVQVTVGDTSRGLLSSLGQDVTLLNFSDATRNGSANLQSVPEPASMIALGCGLAAVLKRRKRG